MSVPVYRLNTPETHWVRRGWPSIPRTTAPDPGAPAFAGHVPYRVIIGLDAPVDGDGRRPEWNEAVRDHVGTVYARRLYSMGLWYNDGTVAPALQWFKRHTKLCDDAGVLPLITVSAPGGANATGWGQIRDGLLDADIDNIVFPYLDARRARNGGNGRPVVFDCSHEPHFAAGTLADYEAYRDMHIHLAAKFSGWNDDFTVYDPAKDYSDICARSFTLNGFTIGSNYKTEIDTILTPALANAFSKARGVAGVDLYDNPLNANQRLWVRARLWRERFQAAGFQHAIIPEWGVDHTTSTDSLTCMTNFWLELRGNRGFWAAACEYDAIGAFDTRVIPETYPIYLGNAGREAADLGGSVRSAQLQTYFRDTMLAESVSPLYTSPL